MKTNLKRTISLFLCLAMVFCVPAFAAEEDFVDAHEGHDCAEHEVAPFVEQSVAEEGIALAAAAACTHPNKVVVDRGNHSTQSTVEVTLANGSKGTCVEIFNWYSEQIVCQSCGVSWRDTYLMSFSHSVAHK